VRAFLGEEAKDALDGKYKLLSVDRRHTPVRCRGISCQATDLVSPKVRTGLDIATARFGPTNLFCPMSDTPEHLKIEAPIS
jgi:hypothetical protein